MSPDVIDFVTHLAAKAAQDQPELQYQVLTMLKVFKDIGKCCLMPWPLKLRLLNSCQMDILFIS